MTIIQKFKITKIKDGEFSIESITVSNKKTTFAENEIAIGISELVEAAIDAAKKEYDNEKHQTTIQ
jgi:hypothetical protein